MVGWQTGYTWAYVSPAVCCLRCSNSYYFALLSLKGIVSVKKDLLQVHHTQCCWQSQLSGPGLAAHLTPVVHPPCVNPHPCCADRNKACKRDPANPAWGMCLPQQRQQLVGFLRDQVQQGRADARILSLHPCQLHDMLAQGGRTLWLVG
jgi:hypothetical protein